MSEFFGARNLTGAQMSEIIEALGGERRALQVPSGKIVAVAKVVITRNTNDTDVWRTVHLGKYRHSFEYERELNMQSRHSDVAASLVLRDSLFKFVATEERDEDLVTLSATDLGLIGKANCSEVFRKGLKLGFLLCPHDTAPALCLQPFGAKELDRPLFFAMEGISGLVFGLECRADGLWLVGKSLTSPCGPHDLVVFVRPRK